MRCYYEVLGVPKNVDNDSLKKAYYKVSLVNHPDKNPDKLEEFTKIFQEIQEAYKVLSDPNERAWYDKNREVLLNQVNGEDFVDDSLNLDRFFSTSCYSGFTNDKKDNFYSVYANVFATIRQEEFDVMKMDNIVPKISEESFPDFGDADSNYSSVVRVFYHFWQGYFTKKKFYWIFKYDIRTAKNSEERRYIEEENKKLRQAAKKERNQNVRDLVDFVKRHDPRVIKQNAILKQRAEDNRKEALSKAIRKRKDEGKALAQEWADQQASKLYAENAEDIEAQLENLERQLNLDSDPEPVEEDKVDVNQIVEELDEEIFYCHFCDKEFRSAGLLKNHQNSRKHKTTVLNHELTNQVVKEKSEKPKEECEVIGPDQAEDSDDPAAEGDESQPMSHGELKRLRRKAKKEKKVLAEKPSDIPQLSCGVCSEKFETRNALFDHIKKYDHAVLKINNNKKKR